MTKEELMNAIMGLPAETQVYKIDDYTDLDHKEYTPSKIDGVRIATARGILTAYEIAVLNGLSEAGKVDCIKVCESFMLPPITYGITNPEEHYITCEKKELQGRRYKDL